MHLYRASLVLFVYNIFSQKGDFAAIPADLTRWGILKGRIVVLPLSAYINSFKFGLSNISMKLAFCLFKYFPYGGLQRDFLRIAKTCRDRGHEIHVYTMHWEGDPEPGLELHLLNAQGQQNHTRAQSFAECVQKELQQTQYDLVIGFNKMPGLDIYYAADVCYQARVYEKRSLLHRLLPRYRQLKALEHAVFARGNKTEILLLSTKQQSEFLRYYQTELHRFHVLPPGITKDRVAPANATSIRAEVRSTLHIKPDEFILLMVGSGFKTKGLDRAITGLANLPPHLRQRCHLFIVGQDNAAPFTKQAQQLGVLKQIHFLGGRPDVPHFLLAADVLVHPAYHENTGTVLLEAMVSGLPVLTADSCGYAHYVEENNAGIVLHLPFKQTEFDVALEKMLVTDRSEWQRNGLAFANNPEIYRMPETTADLIELIGQQRAALSA